MGHSFRIGRVFGIELRVDPSWLFIFVLVGWSLTSLFATWHPDWSLGSSVVVALLSALMFFASVLFHELAHSLVARAYGIPVRDITLHLFGGVSNIEREPPTPLSEFLMAIVGPIASIGLGIAMLLGASLFVDVMDPSHLGPIETLLVWLGPVNVMVGVFNLIPGFPLDGGRVLRAIVWKLTNDLQQATRVAGGAGQAVGWLFITLGAFMAFGYHVPFFGRGVTSGLWLALIGLFLRNAAIMHLRGAVIDQALVGVHVSDLMRRRGDYLAEHMSIRELVENWFMRHDDQAYPVQADDGTLAGIVSIDDVRRVPSEEWGTRTVRDVITPRERLVVTTPSEDLAVALRKLGASEVRQLPVLDSNDVLVGMLYEKDIMRWLELRTPQQRLRHA